MISTWNSWSCILPNFEYCCLKHSCNHIQSTTIGLNDSYHNQASTVRVKQNLWTFATSGKLCVSNQSFVLNKWASASSSGWPENSGLKYVQFNCGCTVFGIWAGGAGGNAGFGKWAGGLCGCIGAGTCAGGVCCCIGSGTWAGMAGGETGSGTSAGGSGTGSYCACCAASCPCCSWGAGCGGAGVVVFALGLHTVGGISAGGPLCAIVASVFTDLFQFL